MSGDELLDAYDRDGRHLGVKSRDAVHRDHDWHWLVFLWSAWVCDGDMRMLLQRRARPEDPFKDSLDALAGGHVLAGESPLQAARRELLEEVGFEPPESELVYLGQRRWERPTNECRRVEQHFYLWNRAVDLMAGNFSDEVSGLVEVDLKELARLLDGDTDQLTGRSRLASRPEEVREICITSAAFAAYPEPILDVFRRSFRAVSLFLAEKRLNAAVWRD